MIIEACIFDLDGVIVDTAKYHYLAWKRLAQKLGFDFTEQQNELLKGVSRNRSLEILLEIGNVKITDVSAKHLLTEKKNRWYVEYIAKITPSEILPNALEFIKCVKQANYKTAIGSASKNTMPILERLKITSYFDAIVDGNKVSHAKPNPEVFLKAAEELNVPAEACVVFEDAQAGIDAAKNAKMKVIGIGNNRNLKNADKVVASLAEIRIDDLKEL